MALEKNSMHVVQLMKEIIWKVISMEKESMYGKMGRVMMENGKKMKWMALEYIHGLKEKYMKAKLKIIYGMAKENRSGLTVELMTEIGKIT